jgi:plastocyanin
MIIKKQMVCSQKTNLLKLCINMGVAVLFTLSISALLSISLALSVEEKGQNNNNNNSKVHVLAYNHSSTALTIISPSNSTEEDMSNKTMTATTATKATSTNKVLIGEEESEKPFNPSIMNITTGDIITWKNNDVEIHTVTSGSSEDETNKGKEFDSGNLNPGQSFEHTFIKAGTYNYFCIIHPLMTGIVNVK